jgi:hypothetical protein
VIAAALFSSSTVFAQSPSVAVGARAVGLYTHVDPVPGGGPADEVQVVQPVAMIRAGLGGRRIVLTGTANLEGLTIPGGELAPGGWGEGFVDRRHPHTYAHELIVSANDLLGRFDGSGELSLSAGKGFAPFGTDDPMVRPVIRYPVNHHLAQILERAVAIIALRQGPATVEAGLFNGDEPERPGQWPRVAHRFGDSWSARGTLVPIAGAELQASYAHVHSPEHRPGAGPDQAKWSAAARWEGALRGHPAYALLEWARTSEAGGFFVYHSLLGEGAWESGSHRLLWRVERTERPEEARTLDPFRSVRPHLDNSILGRTRWSIVTAGYSVQLLRDGSRYQVEPQLEAVFGTVRSLEGLAFDPVAFYGRNSFWSLSLGIRLGWGMSMHRMGRYGALDVTSGMPGPDSHMHW